MFQGEAAGGSPATGLIDACAVSLAAAGAVDGSTAKCTFGKGDLSGNGALSLSLLLVSVLRRLSVSALAVACGGV